MKIIIAIMDTLFLMIGYYCRTIIANNSQWQDLNLLIMLIVLICHGLKPMITFYPSHIVCNQTLLERQAQWAALFLERFIKELFCQICLKQLCLSCYMLSVTVWRCMSMHYCVALNLNASGINLNFHITADFKFKSNNSFLRYVVYPAF